MLKRTIVGFTVLSSMFFCSLEIRANQSSTSYTIKHKAQDFSFHIDKLIEQYASQAHVGIKIVSLKNGATLYQKNANKLFVPASCMKVFSGCCALSNLGPNFCFQTELYIDGEIKDGILTGNLFIKGGGDPDLQAKDLDDLIFQLKLLGIKEISGQIYVDSFAFDGVSKGPGWMWDDGPEYWNSPMGALTVNHSCLSLWVCPGEHVDMPSKIYIYPKISLIKIENQSKTSEVNSNIDIERSINNNTNIVSIKGVVAKKSEPLALHIAVDNPQLFTGYFFAELLAKQKILFSGTVSEKKVPSSAKIIATHNSRPLSTLVQKMMKESDNLYADCFLKKVGQQKYGGQGSWALGSKAVREYLITKGVDTSEMVLLDGSGLSRYNLASPNHFVSFLTEIRKNPLPFEEFFASLPISGVDGTLKFFLNEKDLRSKVRAKSGSMKGIRSLVGYLTTKENEELVFAILINGLVGPRDVERKLENEICKYLATYRQE